jgi:23S rRNA pseudouridine955/2504/2580 synthase
MKRYKFKDLIVFENDNYILINKPAQVASLHERIGVAKSIVQMSKQYHEDAQLCHRLDKETTGIMAIAKNPEAYRNLAIQFEKRKVKKKYHAVAKGVHEFKDLKIEASLAVTAKGVAKVNREKGKESVTIANTIRAFKNHSLIECEPLTGRLHQIRIHLSYCKAPLIADLQYGGEHLYLSEIKRKKFNLKWGDEEQPLMQRVALHAHRLAFADVDGKLIDVEAPYPKDMRALLKQLENYDS